MFAERLAKCQQQVASLLENILKGSSEHISPTPLNEAMRYACLNGGKRLRPLMAYLTAELFDTPWEQVDPIAAAIELIHCYSLIHDDLPAMDDDDLRRGKPTCHKVFGEGMAILAGDALLTEAFVLISQQKNIYPADMLINIIGHLSTAAGAKGMVKGQAMDISAEGQALSLETLLEMHAAKTGALIAASVQCGALATNRASKYDLEKLQIFGDIMGLAFQIQDDILDVLGTPAEMGKTLGKDMQQQKCTFVSLLGLEKAQSYAQQCHQEALSCLSVFGPRAKPLIELSHFMIERVA